MGQVSRYASMGVFPCTKLDVGVGVGVGMRLGWGYNLSQEGVCHTLDRRRGVITG